MNDELQSDSYAQISYLQKYGLTREPFAIDTTTNQDEFFLLDSERAQRLNMLYHMCQNSELLLVVSGAEGSGKTSLLNKFIDMRTDNWRQCVINATATTNPDQLLVEIAEGFGIPQDSVNFGSGLEMLQKRLTEMKRSELMPILIIDDAHELPTASLTILLKLSELSDADERLLRIVLFGEPAINDMFNAPELKEVKHRITHTLTMPLLDEKQSLEYIQYRLSIAGLKDESPFTQAQMKRIHRQAAGVPGLINQFAQDLLLGSMANTNAGTSTSIALRVRSSISVVLILGIAASVTWFLTRDVIDSLGNSQTNKNSTLETRDLPLLPPSTKVSEQTEPEQIIIVETATEFDAYTGSVAAQSAEPSLEPTTSSKEIVEELPSSSPTIVAPDNTLASAPIVTPVDETTNVVVTLPLVTTPVADNNEVPTTAAAIPVTTDVEKVLTVTTTPPVATDVIKPATVKPVATVKPPIKTDWLSQQDPQHFTLQIMGSRKRSSLSLVQRAHKIAKQSAIIHTQLKGSDWYILIHKSFATKQLAREGAKQLPQALQITQPWPRRIQDLKSLK